MNFSQAIRTGGKWNDEAEKNKMADRASKADLEAIKKAILSWGLSLELPGFGKYVHGFWSSNYDLGECSANRQDEVKRNGNNASTNTNVNYICKGGIWEVATEYEYDTYGWGSCSAEGELKAGLVSGKKYVCENSAWRLASTVEASLGGCTAAIQGKVDNIGASYYYCDSKVWRNATEYEYDTYGWACITEGEIKKGNVSEKNYVCKYEVWQIASYKDIVCFEEKNCNYFTDVRDNQRYAYTVIGDQTWMAENLNYSADKSKCHDYNPVNCYKYGRLYDWETAMNNSASSTANPSGVQGVCPFGWHLPSNAEWNALMKSTNPSCSDDADCADAGTKLKATSEWNTDNGYIPGTDDYGFSALPGGYGYLTGFGGPDDGGFYSASVSGLWWSTTEGPTSSPYTAANYWTMANINSSVSRSSYSNSFLVSVRCVKD
jgi:uncharacterized protein (TIGR02145 family)